MKYCPNCGSELKPAASVCLNCGHLIQSTKNSSNGGALSTLSVIFGCLGFVPLLFIGALTGMILGVVGVYEKGNNEYRNRAKIGIWLSVTSFLFWTIIVVIISLNQ